MPYDPHYPAIPFCPAFPYTRVRLLVRYTLIFERFTHFLETHFLVYGKNGKNFKHYTVSGIYRRTCRKTRWKTTNIPRGEYTYYSVDKISPSRPRSPLSRSLCALSLVLISSGNCGHYLYTHTLLIKAMQIRHVRKQLLASRLWRGKNNGIKGSGEERKTEKIMERPPYLPAMR